MDEQSQQTAVSHSICIRLGNRHALPGIAGADHIAHGGHVGAGEGDEQPDQSAGSGKGGQIMPENGTDILVLLILSRGLKRLCPRFVVGLTV